MLTVVAMLLGASSSRAQDARAIAAKPTTSTIGRILGIFDESGKPIEGVDVVDRIGGGTLRTQRSGLVGMGALSSQHDSAVVTIRKIGFADTTILVMVGVRDTVPVQIFLRQATALEQVTVTAKEAEHLPMYLRDFEKRLDDSRWSGAKTFTPAEFRKHDGQRLYDMLFTKQAIGMGHKPCLLVYLNGVRWIPPEIERGSAGVPKEDVDKFDAAVFYTVAQMPAELQHTASGLTIDSEEGFGQRKLCGALLLYSRNKV